MANDVKRLNYFNGQFLRDNDFNDEQNYQLQLQRDHERFLHTPGIADGLTFAAVPAGATGVTIQSGTAYDDLGRRIVLANNLFQDLQGLPAGPVYVTIAFAEEPDASSLATDTGSNSTNTRWKETPLIEVSASAPVIPTQKLVLGVVTRDSNKVITAIDLGARRAVGVIGGDLGASSLTLTSGSVAQSGWVKMSLGATGRADVGGSLNVAQNIVSAGTVNGRNVAADGSKLDAHVASTANPHVTTAAQIDAQGGANQLVAQINAGTGVVADPRIDPAIARQAGVNARFDVNTGHNHDGVDSRKIPGIDANHFASLSGIAITALNGSNVTSGTVVDARIDSAIARQAGVTARFDVNVGHNHDGVDSRKIPAIDATHFLSLSGANLTALNGSQVTTGTVADARIDPLLARQAAVNAKFDVTTGHIHDGVSAKRMVASDVGALPLAGGTVNGAVSVAAAFDAVGLTVKNSAGTTTAVITGNPFFGNTGSVVSVGNPNNSAQTMWIGGGTSIGAPSTRAALLVDPGGVANTAGLVVFAAATGTDTVNIFGTARFSGSKVGYVVDTFVNGGAETLKTGDLVKLKVGGAIAFHGDHNRIPIMEVVLADKEDDSLVMGIVGQEATPAHDEPDERLDPEDPTSIPSGGRLFVVTLGAFAHCKVDATDEPIGVGDLLTSSNNPGYAKKATNPKLGTIIGKALEPLRGTTGYISIFVNIQ